MSAAATCVLLRQSKKQKAIPLGTCDLLRDGTQRTVPTVSVLEAVVGYLDNDGLILELLHNQPARHGQPGVVVGCDCGGRGLLDRESGPPFPGVGEHPVP